MNEYLNYKFLGKKPQKKKQMENGPQNYNLSIIPAIP